MASHQQHHQMQLVISSIELHFKSAKSALLLHFDSGVNSNLMMGLVTINPSFLFLCSIVTIILSNINSAVAMKAATEKFFVLGSGSYTRKLILTNAGRSYA